ncbi:MAG: hypothetical protein ACI857_000218 [Arenicella sp.]|jgi:hypothetical protein
MKFILLNIFFFFTAVIFAQKINWEDPTYMRVDHDYTARLIKWPKSDSLGVMLKKEKWYGFHFAEGASPDSAKLFKMEFDLKEIRPKLSYYTKKLDLFRADTANVHYNRSYVYYVNPVYFDSLIYVDATYLGKQEEKFGHMSKNLLKQVKAEELCALLIHFGVVGTYHHLYSELITTKVIETETCFEINYSVVWHICTNSCNDPTYEFGIKINKESGDIFAFGL